MLQHNNIHYYSVRYANAVMLKHNLHPPQPRRRWLRFSLASLLAVTTVLCILLAIFFNRVRRQERAVRAIEAAGGHIVFDYQQDYLDRNPLLSDYSRAPVPGASWLREYLGDDLFRSPVHVTLGTTVETLSSQRRIDDALLVEHLGGVRTADYLSIDSSHVTDAAMPYIAAMHRVENLDLTTPQVTDTGLSYLAGMRQLVSLRLECEQVTDAGLAHLKGLDQLANLALLCPRLTPDGIRQLDGLTNVREVYSMRWQGNYRLLEILEQPHPLDPLESSLLAALETLAEDTGLPIDTTNLLPDYGPTPLRPATTSTVEDCLEQILEPAGLGWYLEEGTVKITSRDRDRARERRAGYDTFRKTFPNAKLVLVDW